MPQRPGCARRILIGLFFLNVCLCGLIPRVASPAIPSVATSRPLTVNTIPAGDAIPTTIPTDTAIPSATSPARRSAPATNTLDVSATFSDTATATDTATLAPIYVVVTSVPSATVYVEAIRAIPSDVPVFPTSENAGLAGSFICPANCDQARVMGLSAAQAATCPKLDRDHDGVACYGD